MISTAFSYISNILSGKRTWGQFWNHIKFEYGSRKEVLGYDPLTISICTTDNCNLKCDMCLTHSVLFNNEDNRHVPCRDMDIELFRKVLDKFKHATTVLLIGTGEPVLNKDFFKMIEYAKEKKMDVFTVSNGTLLKEYMDDILSSPLDEISISLNGYDEDEFSRLTGEKREHYKVICENIRTLVERRNKLNSSMKICISMIIDKVSYAKLPEMFRAAAELGVDTANFLNFLPVFEIADFSPDSRCLFEDDSPVAELFNNLKIPEKPKINLQPLLKRTVEKRICKAFFTTLRVDGAGNVGSCGRMLLNMDGNGNVLEPDSWNNEYLRSMRRKYIDYSEKLPDSCLVCTNNAGDSAC